MKNYHAIGRFFWGFNIFGCQCPGRLHRSGYFGLLTLILLGSMIYCAYGWFRKEDKKKYLRRGGIVGTVSALAMIGALVDDDATNITAATKPAGTEIWSDENDAAVQGNPDFGITSDRFVSNFNKASSDLGLEARLDLTNAKFTQNTLNNMETASVLVSEELAFVIRRKMDNQRLQGLICILRGMENIGVPAAVGLAIQSDISSGNRKHLNALAIEAYQSEESITYTIDGVQYSANFSQEFGLIFAADPVE